MEDADLTERVFFFLVQLFVWLLLEKNATFSFFSRVENMDFMFLCFYCHYCLK